MSWIEAYEKELDDKLRRRIRRDFPLLEKGREEQLALFLISAEVAWSNKTWWWLEDQLGSQTATQRFLDLYWWSAARRYKAWRACNDRAGTPARRRS
jgi:hypothetical protein